ncbi:hypothetical protein TNCV_3515661 [Trichonephila clavipes]|nr:hypothetical protein TNCV_3515661 [Trichonephila clavipes]
MPEKDGSYFVPGPDYMVDALKLPNQAPRVRNTIDMFNILKDNWGRWKQHSRTLIGSFMARRKPRVLTLGQS